VCEGLRRNILEKCRGEKGIVFFINYTNIFKCVLCVGEQLWNFSTLSGIRSSPWIAVWLLMDCIFWALEFEEKLRKGVNYEEV